MIKSSEIHDTDSSWLLQREEVIHTPRSCLWLNSVFSVSTHVDELYANRAGGRVAPDIRETRRPNEERRGRAVRGGGRARESRRVPQHAPGISYLKFSLSAPRKPFHTVHRDASGRAEPALGGEAHFRDETTQMKWEKHLDFIKDINFSLSLYYLQFIPAGR